MLNIVILGAGDVGQYMAQILSREEHNVILVDKNSKRLEGIASKLDIGTKTGIGTDWHLLDELLDIDPDFFIALTPEDEFNLTACSIAKNLGYKQTISRVKDDRFLNKTRLDFGRVFAVDHFICKELLVANDLMKYMVSYGSLAIESFFNGSIQMRTIPISKHWHKSESPIKDLDLPKDLIVGLIRRNDNTIIPHGDDHILPKDEVTFIGETESISKVHEIFGAPYRQMKSLIMIGGSQVALNLAKLLSQNEMSIRIIEKDLDQCLNLAEQLPKCTIINQDGTNLEILLSEKVDQADLVFVCTSNDETNMMAALLAKQACAKHVAVILSKAEYHPLAEKLGISYAVSPRLATANRLLSLILSSRVKTCVSMYENQAEIVEIKISINSKIIGIPISELGPLLPKDFLIAVIENRGRIFIANGNRILSPGDSIIVVTNPRNLIKLEQVF